MQRFKSQGQAQRFVSTHSAMTCFDDAQKLAAAGNDDAVLRWNACARTMDRDRLDAADGPDEDEGNPMSDDVPVR